MNRTKNNKSNDKIREALQTTHRTQENTITSSNNKWKQSRIHSEKEYDENLPWGDPVDIKEEGVCRIHFQNINGISATDKKFSDAAEIGREAKRSTTDIRCLAETNLDWSDQEVMTQVSGPIRSCYNRAALLTASNEHTKFDSVYQPGGVGMIISEEWTGRIEHKKPDESKMGRWIQCTIRGKDNRKVTMITAYQVVKQSITQAGPKTAYMQQYQRLRLTGHPDQIQENNS